MLKKTFLGILCVCVCVCQSEGGGGRERGGENPVHDFSAEDGIMLALAVSTASVTALSHSLSSVLSSSPSWTGRLFRYPVHRTETLEALHSTLLHTRRCSFS